MKFFSRLLRRGFKMKVEGGNSFVQKVNPLTGFMGWEMTDENYDFHQEIACSMYADMLHDSDRNEKYFLALKKAIEKKHSMGQKANVLDIGTGTGLLSMMAARLKADSIVACEAFSPIADVAKKVIEDNCMSFNIKVVAKRSTELKVGPGLDLEFKANILITEVFDTELIGEGAVETFNHANENLLEVDAIRIPWTSKVFVVPLQSSVLSSCHRVAESFPFSPKTVKVNPTIYNCDGTASVHDLQLSQVTGEDFKIMAKPIHVFDFDYFKPIKAFREKNIEFESEEEGRIDSFGMYWTLDMDQEGEIVISCAPSFIEKTPWRDHWMQAVYHLPKSVPVVKNEKLYLSANHDDFSHVYRVFKTPTKERLRMPLCSCDLHMRAARTRLYSINDLSKWNKYVNIVKAIPGGKTILYLGDVSFLPIAAALNGAKKVICVQQNLLSERVMTSLVAINRLTSVIVVLNSYENDFDEVDYVLSEPYFTESIFPWDSARFWFLAKRLAPKAICLPGKLRILGVPMEFEDLHKIRLPLGNVMGFKMDAFDKLIQDSRERSCPEVDVHPLWEYPGLCLSNPTTLLELDMNENPPEKIVGNSGNLEINKEGTCHGVALWTQWDFGNETIDTGIDQNGKWDMGTKQGIYFNRQISSVSSGQKMDFEASLNPQMGCINFKFAFPL